MTLEDSDPAGKKAEASALPDWGWALGSRARRSRGHGSEKAGSTHLTLRGPSLLCPLGRPPVGLEHRPLWPGALDTLGFLHPWAPSDSAVLCLAGPQKPVESQQAPHPCSGGQWGWAGHTWMIFSGMLETVKPYSLTRSGKMLDRILRSSWKAISPTSLSQASCFDSGDNRGGQSGQWLWPAAQGVPRRSPWAVEGTPTSR